MIRNIHIALRSPVLSFFFFSDHNYYDTTTYSYCDYVYCIVIIIIIIYYYFVFSGFNNFLGFDGGRRTFQFR